MRKTVLQTLSTILIAGMAVASLAGCAGLQARAQAADEAAQAAKGGDGYSKVSSETPVVMTAAEQAVFNATNTYRKAQGMPELQADQRLITIARLRSQDMAKRNYFAHTTPDGSDVFAILRTRRIPFVAAGENLARNNYEMKKAPDVAMNGWIKSPGHRTNLLHPAFGRIGIGLAVAKDGKKYITQVFAD
jgi:uncharacterized protein YkwD